MVNFSVETGDSTQSTAEALGSDLQRVKGLCSSVALPWPKPSPMAAARAAIT